MTTSGSVMKHKRTKVNREEQFLKTQNKKYLRFFNPKYLDHVRIRTYRCAVDLRANSQMPQSLRKNHIRVEQMVLHARDSFPKFRRFRKEKANYRKNLSLIML